MNEQEANAATTPACDGSIRIDERQLTVCAALFSLMLSLVRCPCSIVSRFTLRLPNS